MELRVDDIARMIDHSLLQPSHTTEELERGCREALDHAVASVCILPHYLRRCAEILKGSAVKASTTIGFPHGGHAPAIKLAEVRQALADGGQELDMVVNVGRVLSGEWDAVRDEIRAVTVAAHDGGAKVKVIFETCLLKDEHKIRLCGICGEIGVDWVKTSTGFGAAGATAEDVVLLRKHSPPHVQVKASGGVRDLDQVLRFRALGATRIGTKATKEILAECRRRQPETGNPQPAP